MQDSDHTHSRVPIIPGYEEHVVLILTSINQSIETVRDPSMRRSMERVRDVGVAMAAVAAAPNAFDAHGEDLLAHLDSPTSGHLVAAMTLVMSHYRTSPDGATSLLAYVMTYIGYIASELLK